MENDIVNTKLNENRVSSTYAEIYFDDDHCFNKYVSHERYKEEDNKQLCKHKEDIFSDWISPSDLLIGIIDLKPPFTCKINRGKTHEGILHIGNTVLEHERSRFLKSLSNLVQQNDASWQHILTHEKEAVIKRVQQIYDDIFTQKSKIMTDEISKFYEDNLQELEEHLLSEIQTVLKSAHANIISILNDDVKHKLKKEKKKLEDVLRKRLLSEVQKINTYYNLIFRKEESRNETVISHALHERNNAIQAFLRQIEAEKFTSSMYVMSLERKKCKIKKITLKSYHNSEMLEKLNKFKEKQDTVNDLREKEVTFSDINKEWEERIRKILQLFLKFISFSLKLLPEQSTFLLDLEKMVVLQLNEIQKDPEAPKILLLDENDLANTFTFKQCEQKETDCNKEPFILIGDLSDPIPTRYWSTETLPSNVDLPVIRLQRQYMYAKCHGYEDIKKLLKSQICKCAKMPSVSPSSVNIIDDEAVSVQEINIQPGKSVSSEELLLCEDFRRRPECPARRCSEWVKRDSFPSLPLYVDFTEENYNRVTAILGKPIDRKVSLEMIQPKEMVYRELPFSITKEPFHTIETQYSSQETINEQDIPCACTCKDDYITTERELQYKLKDSSSDINIVLNKRKISLQRLLNERPNLLQFFTDECYDIRN